MDTVIVKNSQFYSHCQKRIAKGNVNAEKIEIRLDSEWDGLTVRIHWLNVASNVERKPLLERDQPNTIPWEVLTDLGELRMGLVGLDGETVIKPTIWLTYGYVVDGVDPEAGDDPQPPTPSWEQQMVEQATQANQAAQVAQKAAEEAAKSLASAGPYAEEAKKSAEAAKASEEAAATSAQQANAAAQTAQNAAGSIGDAVKRAEDAATAAGAAQQAAEAAQNAAAQSAGIAQTAAGTAAEASLAAQKAAKEAGGYLDSVEADAQAAIEAKTQAQTAATQAGTAKDGAETAAKNAEEYAKQALASVLPNSSGIPDNYVLLTKDGLPTWAKSTGGGDLTLIDEVDITPSERSITFDLKEIGKTVYLFDISCPKTENGTKIAFQIGNSTTNTLSARLTNVYSSNAFFLITIHDGNLYGFAASDDGWANGAKILPVVCNPRTTTGQTKLTISLFPYVSGKEKFHIKISAK